MKKVELLMRELFFFLKGITGRQVVCKRNKLRKALIEVEENAK